MLPKVLGAGFLAYLCAVACQATDQGSAVNPQKVTSSTSPLISAASGNDLAMVQEVIDKHTDLNAEDGEGKTALHWAAELNEEDIVRVLLKAHANPNIKDKLGDTPLTLAYSGKYSRPIVLTLLDAGADLHYTKAGDWSLAHVAICDIVNADVLKKMLEKGLDARGSDVDNSDPNHPTKGNPYIFDAASNGSPATVRALLEHGANPNAKSLANTYPVFVAASKGVAMLKVLVEYGVDVNKKDPQGHTLLAFLEAEIKGADAFVYPNGKAEIGYLKAHGAHK
jgi:ankyrin repeat protein